LYSNSFIIELLEILEKNKIDYTEFFRNLSEYIENNNLENIRKKYNFSEVILFSEKLENILKKQNRDL
jgi:uncharacterized protein YdiU (UPF0061 family)